MLRFSLRSPSARDEPLEVLADPLPVGDHALDLGPHRGGLRGDLAQDACVSLADGDQLSNLLGRSKWTNSWPSPGMKGRLHPFILIGCYIQVK